MSAAKSIPTFEEIRELFRETREQMKETDRKIERMSQETDRQIRRMSKEIGALGSRTGRIIESMVKGDIVAQFQALDYNVTQCSQNRSFRYKELGICGEVDLFLENGEIAILIEVKTTLERADVREHIERLEKYRRYVDATGHDKRHFIGAVAGAVVSDEVADFAMKNGMYVIVQSGKAVEIVEPPERFQAKEW